MHHCYMQEFLRSIAKYIRISGELLFYGCDLFQHNGIVNCDDSCFGFRCFGGCDSPHPTSTAAAIVVIRYFMDALFVMRRRLLFKLY